MTFAIIYAFDLTDLLLRALEADTWLERLLGKALEGLLLCDDNCRFGLGSLSVGDKGSERRFDYPENIDDLCYLALEILLRSILWFLLLYFW